MDYHEMMPRLSHTNGPFLINAVDDWWRWNSYITGLARCLRVRDILLGEKPYPVEPVRPSLANWIAQDAAGEERTEATPGQLGLYKAFFELYVDEREEYRFKIAALATIFDAIFHTVSPSHMRRFVNISEDNEAEIYRKLKENLEPSLEEEKSRILQRYSRLQRESKPTSHQGMDKWLGEWGIVLSVCARLKMEDLAGWLGAWDFLTALKAIEPKYAEERLSKLRRDQSADVFHEIQDYRSRWDSKSRRQQNAILRAVKGQASD